MTAELGYFALILAFFLALAQAVIPLAGFHWHNLKLMILTKSVVWGQFFFLLVAFLVLAQAFITDDFSVAYVANNSNQMLPWVYKISAIWGAHEGSLLLWSLILSLWTLIFSCKSKHIDYSIVTLALSTLGFLSAGFLSFMLFTSSPFDRMLLMPPMHGADLNPLLQDFGLIIHPPLLYSGYVGFAIPFAFAIAALTTGKLDAAWIKWIRPWTVVAWAFLTIGIALGSWWAYYELGWGGWWFWDPVENASLLPWLSGTALMHSLAINEKRNVLRRWTLLLAITSFSLSLLGTFMVRSGVLTSVHAFAADPQRGLFILAFLLLVVGCSLTLFAFRAADVGRKPVLNSLSAEGLLLLNNILLITACSTVLLGTIFPLIADALGMGKLSVGAPYFNALFVPMTWLLALTLGIGITARWKRCTIQYLYQQLRWIMLLSVVAGCAVALLLTPVKPAVIITLVLSIWILSASLKDCMRRIRNRGNFWRGICSIGVSVWGMHFAHIGVAVAMTGVVMTTYYSAEKDVRLIPGQRVDIGDYSFKMQDVIKKERANYISDYATILVYKKGHQIAVMNPEKRFFFVRGMMMTEAAIDPGFTRDLYVALGEPLDGGAWAVRLQIKSFVRWIWLGAIFMALGGVLAILDRRYRVVLQKNSGNNISTAGSEAILRK